MRINRPHIWIGLLLALALACAATAAPYASASYSFLPRSSLEALSKLHARLDSRQPAEPAAVSIVRVPAEDAFNWGDAAIGGAAVFATCAIGLGATLVAANRNGRRSKRQQTTATS